MVDEHVEKLKPSLIAEENVELYIHFGKLAVVKKLNRPLPCILAIPFLTAYPVEMEICLYKDLCSNNHSSSGHNSYRWETAQI